MRLSDSVTVVVVVWSYVLFTPVTLTVSATGVNKTYDQTTTTTVTLSDNRIAGDTITDAYTSAAFAQRLQPHGNHRLHDSEHHATHADGQRDWREQNVRPN